jgi:hypothetical protein
VANRRGLWLALALGVGVPLAVIGVVWYGWASPKLYRSTQSPDGGWRVNVMRRRNPLYPLVDGVEVTVEVRSGSGKLMLRDAIDSRDRWEDVEARYPEVVCRDDSILVGPGWFDGHQSRYYSVARVGITHSQRPRP